VLDLGEQSASLSPPAPRQTVYWYYSSENLSPLVTPEFLARQRRLLMPAQFAREHQNLWIDAADSFASAADVDAAMAWGWTEQLAGAPDGAYVIVVDFGVVHDPTVIGVGHADTENRIVVDKLVTFQGSREKPVQVAAVEACIRDLAARFPCWKVRIESWQGIAAAQSLAAVGLPVELLTPTVRTNAEEWPVLSQRLTTRTLVLPSHARLREELLNLTYEVGATGIRVVDRGAVHQDHAVAVRMLCAAYAAPVVVDMSPSDEELAALRDFQRQFDIDVLDEHGVALDVF
jgi:hypothetical protein